MVIYESTNMHKIAIKLLFPLVKLLFPLVFLVFLAFLFSCTTTKRNEVHFAFSLPLGTLDGEFNVWIDGAYAFHQSTLGMDNNIFYIANGNRIMQFSSRGILLNTIDEKKLNREIGNVQKFSVDSQARIYFTSFDQGSVLPISAEDDSIEKGLNQLLVYDSSGGVDRYGRTGRQSFDFTAIQELHSIRDDQLFVLSLEKKGKTSYLFDSEGQITNTTFFSSNVYPQYPFNKKENNLFGDVNTVVPSYDGRHLYAQIDYYDFQKDENTDSILQIKFLDSLVFKLSLLNAEYEEHIDVSYAFIENLELQYVNANSELFFFDFSVGTDSEDSVAPPKIIKTDSSGAIQSLYVLELPKIDLLTYNMP